MTRRLRWCVPALALLAACEKPLVGGGPPDTAEPPTATGTLRVEPQHTQIAAAPSVLQGGTVRMTAFAVPPDAATAAAPIAADWRSLDPRVAQVGADGTVVAGRAGTARIVATAGERVAVATVAVEPLPDTAILVIAHRGFAHRFPENTVEAIIGAYAAGAHGVELDLRLTADGVPVLMHDASVGRTTNGRGAVADLPWSEVRRLDACAHARPVRAPCAVPTLHDALTAANGRLLVLQLYGAYRAHDLGRVLREIRETGMAGQVVLTSFELPVLDALRQLDATVALGWITTGAPWPPGLSALAPAAVSLPDQRALLTDTVRTRRLVAELRARRVELAPWTVQGYEDAERLVALGVRRLISDVPLDPVRLAAARR